MFWFPEGLWPLIIQRWKLIIKGHKATYNVIKPCITTCLYTILQVKVTMWVNELPSGNLLSLSAFLVHSVRSHMGRQRVIGFLLLFYLLSKFPESSALGDTVFTIQTQWSHRRLSLHRFNSVVPPRSTDPPLLSKELPPWLSCAH